MGKPLTAFGKLFYHHIAAAGLSDNHCAKAWKTSSGYLSGIAGGSRTPPLSRVVEWAEYLGIPGGARIEFYAQAALMHCPEVVQKAVDGMPEVAKSDLHLRLAKEVESAGVL